ncbi:MAG: FmdB family transcriptional regulator [Gemmatimonadetes bacterium]|nr:FmdB family transcriptional regulator [Gemmatimonadota bacterium]NIQ59180.1 FmdB family transcriptional regulator [Gemmatimonadota bacterium]NIU79373.1 FmdB family transcriptional regulator [Gammaproteobacteria bacterium]NIX48042.1 FmdB family transcriptional regulator [Gemmatimonadota bacterium]NIY12421.1 FmdB family transcriptional regulator [Gemmatimonadota bacterium]
MPTYEYLCKQCGDRFEVFQSFSAKPVKRHEECGGEVQKVFHARGIVFKGSGFYVTDSRGSSSASTSTSSDASTSSD